MLSNFVFLLFWLIVAHALCDYPLQGDFLAQGKNRNTAVGKLFWPHCLFAHCVIHAGAIALITGSIWLGLAEGVIHALTDWLKCENRISFNTDQFIHLGCKVLWAVIAIWII